MSACPHHWTVTSECPKCLRAQLDEARAEVAELLASLDAAGFAVQQGLRDVAERQREACADQARFYAGLGWDGEKVQEKVLSTPLVTEAGNNG